MQLQHNSSGIALVIVLFVMFGRQTHTDTYISNNVQIVKFVIARTPQFFFNVDLFIFK